MPGGTEPKAGDHINGFLTILGSSIEHGLIDRHICRGTEQPDPGNTLLVAHRRIEGDQRAHGMPDQRRLFDPGGIEQRHDPVGHGGNAGKCVATAAAMGRQVNRQHIVAAIGKIPALQRPDRVIHTGAVNEHDARLSAGQFLARCRNEGAAAIYLKLHCPTPSVPRGNRV